MIAEATAYNTEQKFYTLLAIGAFILTGVVFVIRYVAKMASNYQKGLDRMDNAADAIVNLGEDLKELIRSKEREHDRLDMRIARNEERIERHEQWHIGREHYERS